MEQAVWKTIKDLSEVDKVQVFSGGACNILDADGLLLRNQERDRINEWMTEQGVWFFDPQIHPDTHGAEYQYELHHPLEVAARGASKVKLYEISPRTFGGISCLEIAADYRHVQAPLVIYFSDGLADQDAIPKYSKRGHPMFNPDAMQTSPTAMQAHYREMVKNANNMRKYVMRFAREIPNLTVVFGEHVRNTDIVISPERMHASDLFRAVTWAMDDERVIVAFTGGPNTRDSAGNPMMLAPVNPPEIEMRAMLDQYLDEGNIIRQLISELIQVNVFSRVVYTQKSAILALEEVLRVRGFALGGVENSAGYRP